jgi:hypothetical protein
MSIVPRPARRRLEDRGLLGACIVVAEDEKHLRQLGMRHSYRAR